VRRSSFCTYPLPQVLAWGADIGYYGHFHHFFSKDKCEQTIIELCFIMLLVVVSVIVVYYTR